MTCTLGYWILIASFASNQDAGIYLYRLDTQTGRITQVCHMTQGVTRPLFLASNQSASHIYATDLINKCDDTPGGAIAAYRFNSQTGELQFLNHKPAHGKVPCYLDIAKNNHFATVANYSDSHVSVLKIESDGRLGALAASEQYHGKSINPKRQTASHPHCFCLSPDGQYALAADLGTDRIMVHHIDTQTGKLTPNKVPYFATPPGAGPRHLTFHPNGKLAFLVTELDNTLLSLRWDASLGTFELLDKQSTLPEGYDQVSYGADIHVHPNGKFLYATNRGHDSLVIMGIDTKTGKLSTLGYQPTQGSFPRSFAIDPLGRFLVVANEKSNQFVTFKINANTGLLSPLGQPTPATTPTSIVIIPIVGNN